MRERNFDRPKRIHQAAWTPSWSPALFIPWSFSVIRQRKVPGPCGTPHPVMVGMVVELKSVITAEHVIHFLCVFGGRKPSMHNTTVVFRFSNGRTMSAALDARREN